MERRVEAATAACCIINRRPPPPMPSSQARRCRPVTGLAGERRGLGSAVGQRSSTLFLFSTPTGSHHREGSPQGRFPRRRRRRRDDFYIKAPPTMAADQPNKEAAQSFLQSLLNKKLRIHTTDERMFWGDFKCTDPVCSLSPRNPSPSWS